MLRFLTILIFLFAYVQAGTNDDICRRPKAEQNEVVACSKNFAIHSCQDLVEQNVELKYLNTCGQYEDQKIEPKSENPILSACGKGLAQSFEALKKTLAKPYEWFKDWTPKNLQCAVELADRLDSIHHDAEVANKKLKNNPEQYQKEVNQYMSMFGGSLVRGCTMDKQLKTNFLNIPSKEEVQEILDYLFRSAHCLNGEGRSKMLCPVIAELAVGTFTGPALRGLRGLGTKASLWIKAGRKLEKAETRLEKMKTPALSVKEVASLAHQDDLLAFASSARMKSRLEKMDIDVESLRHGMVDSDLGKLASMETRFFRELNPDSTELFNTLKGKALSPAGKYLRESLDESDLRGKTLLNPDMPNEKIMAALEANPRLRGYLHELPGLMEAIRDVNRGTIDVNQFKNRVKANLFHNGPNEGYWKTLSEKEVPGGLNKSGHSDFFKGTVFDGGSYPGALSPEGVVHTLIDRLSQGTRGGLDKIFKEIGGADLNKSLVGGQLTRPLGEVGFPGQKGVQVIEDLVSGNAARTQAQMKALREHVSGMAQLSASQRDGLLKMVDEALERLDAQAKEMNKMVRFHKHGDTQSITIDYIDGAGKRVTKTITNESTSGEALNEIANAFKAEERINGDPIRDFSVRAFKERKVVSKLGLYAGAACSAGQLLLPDKKSDEPITK